MARSLVITKEEHATTSPLLTGFLVLAFLWLALSGLSTAATDPVEAPVPAEASR